MQHQSRSKEIKTVDKISINRTNIVKICVYCLVDAFVALGGSIDKSNFVSKSNLIETIQREFELTFDIENMIDGVNGDSLDYDTFCSIFEHDK